MPANQNFVLTTATDNIVGDATDNVISGDSSTFSSADVIDGGAGNDTLNLSAPGPATFRSTQVSNVETANVTGYNTVTVDAHAWTGLNGLNVSAIGGDTITAPSGAAVTDHVQYLGAGSIAVDGGTAVTVDATNATTGTITIGATTATTGVVTVNRTTTGSVSAGAIAVTGGSTVNVTQNATNTASGNQSHGAVTVNGTAATTTVNVAAASGLSTTYNRVSIGDVNAGSSTAGGTITTVSADGYTTISIADTALTDLSLTRGQGNIVIDNSGLASPTNTTLNLTLNGVTGGSLIDANIYSTVRITTTGVKSRLANISAAAVTDLVIDGSTGLSLTSTAGLASLAHVTVAGSAGVTADFGSVYTLTSLDASATTGTSTVSINGSRTSYAGGAGVDNVTTVGSNLSKAISLGGGDDTLTLAAGTTLPTATIDGGTGNDTLGMGATDAATASASSSFAAKVTGFETLALTGGTGAQTIDLAALGGYTAVTTGGEAVSGTLTLRNLASGGTLTLTSNAGAGSAYVVANTAFSTGASDTLNLKLVRAGVLAAGTVNAADVENVNIATSDTQATLTNLHPLDTLTLVASSAKSITISGNAGLYLTAASTNLTSVDASGITTGDFTWTSGALTAAATVKGSATGSNRVILGQAGAPVTYVGGSGADTVIVGAGNNTITTGAGADSVTIAANGSLTSFSTITDAHDAEKIGFASQGTEVFASNKLTLGAGASLADYANAVITGAGDGSTNGHLGWFQFGGNTYLVESRSAAHTSFTDGSDAIVELQGLFDLSTATLNSHALLLSDTTAPAQPSTPALADASDSGTLGDGLTTVTTPIVTGTAENGSRVTLFDTNGSTVLGTGLADGTTGAYSITSSTLGLGTHGLTVKATDASGNVSAASAALTLTIQDGAPPAPTGGGGSGGSAPSVPSPVIVTAVPDAPVVTVPAAPTPASPTPTVSGDTPAPSNPAVTEDFVSDIVGEPYTAYHTRYDSDGEVAVRTFFGPGGNVLKQESTDRAADGSKTVMTSKGNDLAQQPFFAYVDHYAADGTQTEQDVFYRDEHQSVEGLVAGLTLNAISNDTFFTAGGSNTFAFTSGFGHDTITSFVLGGDDHDTIDLPAASQGRLRSILGHATSDENGDAVLHLGHGDAITIQGVTVADLRQHRGDFTFQG